MDGEITLKFDNGCKNVLSIQYKDYYKDFVRYTYEHPTVLHNGRKCIFYADF